MPEIWEVQEKPPAMSADSFEVREYQTADEAEVLTLLGQALGDGRAFARTSAFWQWKHFQNPFGPSLMMVAVSRGVLGLRAFLRWQFHVGTQTLSAIRAVDTATHPTHRRHGVFATLTHRTVERARDEGVDLIFNTPNQQSLPGYVKLGWSYVGRPPMLVRVLRPLRVARGDVRPVAGGPGAGDADRGVVVEGGVPERPVGRERSALRRLPDCAIGRVSPLAVRGGPLTALLRLLVGGQRCDGRGRAPAQPAMGTARDCPLRVVLKQNGPCPSRLPGPRSGCCGRRRLYCCACGSRIGPGAGAAPGRLHTTPARRPELYRAPPESAG